MAKWEASCSELSAEERSLAFQDPAIAVQDGVDFRDTTLNRLVVTRDINTGLLLCGGRVQSSNKDGIAVPLNPFQSWLGTLLARDAHEANHEGAATTLLRTRRKAWVVQGRRTVKKVINECITCKKQRARLCQQVMSDLPQECTRRAHPSLLSSQLDQRATHRYQVTGARHSGVLDSQLPYPGAHRIRRRHAWDRRGNSPLAQTETRPGWRQVLVKME